ncbi:MAG: hypothetical protein H8D42_05940 [Candidatus Marinimicrobia bacterium]|nr:hypothetical protein [Candidatus Neomarinimicrobiota bacterium]
MKNIFEPSNPDLNQPPAKNWDDEPARDTAGYQHEVLGEFGYKFTKA